MNNEKFLQEAPSNNEIHRAEILFSHEKKLQRYDPLKNMSHFTESNPQIQITLSISSEEDQKNFAYT